MLDAAADEVMVEKCLERFDAGLTARNDIEHLDPTELIVLRREQGRTDAEIYEEAASLGIANSVAETLAIGVTHFIEADFAGWIALEFLEIRDGRVRRKATAGRAAEADAQFKAQKAGYAGDLGL